MSLVKIGESISITASDIQDVESVLSDPEIQNKFEKIVDDLGKDYEKELKDEEKVYDKLKKDSKYKDLTEGIDEKMYKPKKTRKFVYTTVPNTDQTIINYQTNAIRDLYKSVNTGPDDDKTFNGKVKFSKT